MRTPEETVRLANGVTVETPHGPVGASCLVMGNAYPHPSAMPDRAVTVSEHLAYALADLAEARAEVARQEAEIADLQRYIREDEERGDGRLDCGSNNCLTATGPLTGMRTNGGCSCGNRALRLAIQKARAEVAALREAVELVREWQAAEAALRLAADDPWRIGGAVAAVEAIEARLLAAVIPEVSRG